MQDIQAREKGQGRARPWYRLQAKSNKTAELWIYDEISWWGVSAASLVDELREIDADQIDVHINSPGGDVFDGIAIYTALKEHPADIHVRIDALAASIASVIAMSGDRISITKPGSMMIHDAWGLAIGNAEDMRTMAAVLDTQSDIIATVYADRAGGTRDEWRTRMKDELWLDSKMALDLGLVDEIRGEEATEEGQAAAARWDLSIFNRAEPGGSPPPPAPDPEPKIGDSGLPDVEVTWDDLPDAAFVGLSACLTDAATDRFEYDPDLVREAIRERAENAPAEPKVESRVVTTARTHVSMEELATALWEGLQ